MGMALSKDKIMGDDDAIVCKIWVSYSAIERYYNPGRTRPVYMSATNPSLGLSNANIVYNGTALVCSFRRDKATGGNSQYFDLNVNYFLLIAQGTVPDSKKTAKFSVTPNLK